MPRAFLLSSDECQGRHLMSSIVTVNFTFRGSPDAVQMTLDSMRKSCGRRASISSSGRSAVTSSSQVATSSVGGTASAPWVATCSLRSSLARVNARRIGLEKASLSPHGFSSWRMEMEKFKNVSEHWQPKLVLRTLLLWSGVLLRWSYEEAMILLWRATGSCVGQQAVTAFSMKAATRSGTVWRGSVRVWPVMLKSLRGDHQIHA